MLTTHSLEEYRENGWVVLHDAVPRRLLDDFYCEFNELLRLAAGEVSGGKGSDDGCDLALLLQLADRDRERLAAVYRSCRHLGSLQRLLLHDDFLAAARTAMQTDFLNVCPYTATRIDLRGEEKYLFDWHQDYHYIQGSVDGVVLWIPLSELDTTGAVQVLTGSHAAGLQKVRVVDPENRNRNGAKTLSLDLDAGLTRRYRLDKPQLGVGDVFFFSTLLLHKSVPQVNERVRVTTQLRYGNFRLGDAIARGWPVGLLEGRRFEMDHPEFVLPE